MGVGKVGRQNSCKGFWGYILLSAVIIRKLQGDNLPQFSSLNISDYVRGMLGHLGT